MNTLKRIALAIGTLLLDKAPPPALLGWIVLLASVLVVGAWSAFLALEVLAGPSVLSTLGPLGDSLGVFTALFSGTALAMTGAALLIQTREYKESREAQKQMAETQRIVAQLDSVEFMLGLDPEIAYPPKEEDRRRGFAAARGKQPEELSDVDQYEIHALIHERPLLAVRAALHAKMVQNAILDHGFGPLIQSTAYSGITVNGEPADAPYAGGLFGTLEEGSDDNMTQ